mmetsp:Transcript_24604/g.62674  ORF Transcript_24604/g.62674 Transcript_24604/m.62674 type:complete len:203 (-) Transcript_24604:3633-4241(-)
MSLNLSTMTPMQRLTMNKLPMNMNATKKRLKAGLFSRAGSRSIPRASIPAIITSTHPSVVEISNRVMKAVNMLSKFRFDTIHLPPSAEHRAASSPRCRHPVDHRWQSPQRMAWNHSSTHTASAMAAEGSAGSSTGRREKRGSATLAANRGHPSPGHPAGQAARSFKNCAGGVQMATLAFSTVYSSICASAMHGTSTVQTGWA